MNYEQLAVPEVARAIARTRTLEPFFHTHDREPVYDGYIAVYRSPDGMHRVKDLLCRIPVVIKLQVGITETDEINYRLKTAVLRCLHDEKRAVFFVVQMNEEYDNAAIFFHAFTGSEAEKILDDKNDLSTVSLRFRRFPTERVLIEKLFYSLVGYQYRVQYPYTGSDPYIFLSYNRKDSAAMEPIAHGLAKRGYRVWQDTGLIPGSTWDEDLTNHIKNCEFCIALISKDYSASQSCLEQLQYARVNNVPCLLVSLDDARLPDNLRFHFFRSQFLNVRDFSSTDELLDRLAKASGIVRCQEPLSAPASDKYSSTFSSKRSTLFLSYCSKDNCIADIIDTTLTARTSGRLNISRYTRLSYKDSFKQFMNSIQEHDYVLTIVSDNYLKSQACMYEVGEIIKDHNYHGKLLFVVLRESDRKYYPGGGLPTIAAKIYGDTTNRLAYVQYWKSKYDDVAQKIKEIGDSEATSSATKDLNEIGRIYRHDISEFTNYLADSNGKTFEELYSNDFEDILKWIFPK